MSFDSPESAELAVERLHRTIENERKAQQVVKPEPVITPVETQIEPEPKTNGHKTGFEMLDDPARDIEEAEAAIEDDLPEIPDDPPEMVDDQRAPSPNAAPSSAPQSNLTAADLAMLARSYITPEIAQQARLKRVDSIEGARTVGRKPTASRDYAGLIFPCYWAGNRNRVSIVYGVIIPI